MTVSHVLDTYYKKDSVNESALKFLLLIQKLRLIQVTGNFSGISQLPFLQNHFCNYHQL